LGGAGGLECAQLSKFAKNAVFRDCIGQNTHYVWKPLLHGKLRRVLFVNFDGVDFAISWPSGHYEFQSKAKMICPRIELGV